MKKRPKSARNLLKSDEKSEEKLISKWGRIDQASQITSQQNKKMIQEYQKRDQEDIERRLQVKATQNNTFFTNFDCGMILFLTGTIM